MRKVICILVILMMTVGVFAETPVLISAMPFGLEQDGNNFTIIVDENPTTGYTWTYTVKDDKHVKFVSDDYKSESNLIGAGGSHKYEFEVLKDGVSTIKFVYKRPFETSAEKEFTVLVYKNGDKVIIEEDQIVTIAQPVKEKIEATTESLLIDSTYMFDLDVLKSMGYKVTKKENTIEINKGAQWTSVTIGKNAYFKNRMAARPLSSEPVEKDGKVYLPIEFANEILDLGLQVKDKTITLNTFENGHYTGYVKEITVSKNGTSLHLVYNKDAKMTDIVLHLSVDNTYVQNFVQVGDKITAITSMATTMSLPPQTAAYIIY